MAYEMRFYIGTKHTMKGTENPDYNFFQKIATFDYGQDTDLGDFVYKYDSAKVFGYLTQDEEEEILDKYGEEFKEIPFEDLIEYLDTHKDFEYGKYLPFKMLIEGFAKNQEKFNSDTKKLILIEYGY